MLLLAVLLERSVWFGYRCLFKCLLVVIVSWLVLLTLGVLYWCGGLVGGLGVCLVALLVERANVFTVCCLVLLLRFVWFCVLCGIVVAVCLVASCY